MKILYTHSNVDLDKGVYYPEIFKLYGGAHGEYHSIFTNIDGVATIGTVYDIKNAHSSHDPKGKILQIDPDLTINTAVNINHDSEGNSFNIGGILKHSSGDIYVTTFGLREYYKWDFSIIRFDSNWNKINEVSYRASVWGFEDYLGVSIIELPNGDIFVGGDAASTGAGYGYNAVGYRYTPSLTKTDQIAIGGSGAGGTNGRRGAHKEPFIADGKLYFLYEIRYYTGSTGVAFLAEIDISGSGLNILSRKKIDTARAGQVSPRSIVDGDFVYLFGGFRGGSWSGESNPHRNAYALKYNYKTYQVVQAMEYSFDDQYGYINDVFLDDDKFIFVGHTGNNTPNPRKSIIGIIDKATLTIDEIRMMSSTTGSSSFNTMMKYDNSNIVVMGYASNTPGNIGGEDLFISNRALPLRNTGSSLPAGFTITDVVNYTESPISINVGDDPANQSSSIHQISPTTLNHGTHNNDYTEVVFNIV